MVRRVIAYFHAHRIVTFLAIFLLSVSVRSAILMHFRGDILEVGEEPRIAYAILEKGEYGDPYAIPTGPTAHSTPFFVVLLVGVYKVLGTGLAGQLGRCSLIIFGYSALFALYPTFASAFGFPFEGGLLAGFVSALLPVRRSFEVFRGWEEPYAAITLAFILLFTLRRYQAGDRSLKSAVQLGLCWGASMYIGFSLFSILCGILFVDVLINRNLRVLVDGCVIMVVTFAVMSPWLLRNHRVLHAWTLMRDNFGIELLQSNHQDTHPSSEEIAADPGANVFYMHPRVSVAEATLVRDMGEVNYNRRCTRLAKDWISSHPREFAWLTVQRFAFFWLGPLNHLYESAVTSAYTLLGLVGIAFIRKRVGPIQFQLWCTVLFFYPLMYYFIAHTTRYRVQIDWMIWLSAGLVIRIMLEKFSPSWLGPDAKDSLRAVRVGIS